MSDLVDMIIKLPNLTRSQAIALEAMFNMWKICGNWGCSRMVSFMVDGDGNFRPKTEIELSEDPYNNMTAEERMILWTAAQISRPQNTKSQSLENPVEFDFDPVAARMN